ncbi:MAG: type II secretion system major pseudopilin GspG [Desulfobacteraceae bacterium]|jgi:general secretion pathway protein G
MKKIIFLFKVAKPRFTKFWTDPPKFYPGFTLIEIMVVIVILGILATLIIPRFMGREEEARRTMARVQMESIETALKLYKLDNGVYPSTEQGLQALIEPPTIGQVPRKWREGGYLEKSRVPKDPWDNDYIYLSPGVHGDLDLISYGADGEPGGEGNNKDINNWELE